MDNYLLEYLEETEFNDDDYSFIDRFSSEITKNLENNENEPYISNSDFYDKLFNNDFKENNQTFNQRQYNICSECENSNIIEDTVNGVTICGICGCILSTMIEMSAEWLNYNDDSKKMTTHGYTTVNSLLPNSSFASIVKTTTSKRIRSMHIRQYMLYEERRLSNIFKIIQKACEKAKLSKCIEDDMRIFFNNITKVADNECKNLLFRGKNLTGMIGACMYFACKKNKDARTPNELSNILGVTAGKITKGIKMFVIQSKIKGIQNIDQLITPEQFVVRLGKKINIKQQYIDQALTIVKNVAKLEIATEHNPVSVATGSIFLMIHMNNLDLTRKFIAESFKVSLVTISKTFKKFLPFSKILMRDDICNKLNLEIQKYKAIIELKDELKPKFIKFGAIPKFECNIYDFVVVNNNNNNNNNLNNNKILFKKQLFNKFNFEINDYIKRQEFTYNRTMTIVAKIIKSLEGKINKNALCNLIIEPSHNINKTTKNPELEFIEHNIFDDISDDEDDLNTKKCNNIVYDSDDEDDDLNISDSILHKLEFINYQNNEMKIKEIIMNEH